MNYTERVKKSVLILMLVLGFILAAGCVTSSGVSRPKNWIERVVTLDFTKNPIEKQEAAQKGLDKADDALVKKAQEAVVAIGKSLDKAEPSVAVDTAKAWNDQAKQALDVAVGPVLPERMNKLNELVSWQLDNTKQVESTKAFDKWKRDSELIAKTHELWKKDRDQYVAESAAWAKERDETAKKWERMWFWIWFAVGGYVFVAWVLPILAAAFPALGAANKLVHGIVSPVFTMAAHKTERVLGDVVGGVEELRAKVLNKTPELKAEASAVMREWVTESDGTAAAVDAVRRKNNHI